MPKVRLQHKGKSVSIELDPDAGKVTNHNPLRFRISHDVTVNTGINTWFMSRKQLEEVNLQVLTEILEAKQPGGEEAVSSAERRVAKGQQDLVRSVQQISRLTHPDVMMLIDMRQNPNQYVNSSSAFANMFNALARKVMDLSFYATHNGPNPKQQREDFIRTTGAVTRGMDQFIYCRPNASEANPYVNFSVIPAGQNYEDVRFPTHYDARLETKEKIPKTRFKEIYAYYVNELFDCYRRYLRMLGAAEILPGNTDEVSAAVFEQPPGEGPEEGGDDAEALIAGMRAGEEAQEQADQEAIQRAREESEEAARLEFERQANKHGEKLDERSRVVKEAVKGALDEFQEERDTKARSSQRNKAVEKAVKRAMKAFYESQKGGEPSAPPEPPAPGASSEGVPDVSSSSLSSFESPTDRALQLITERLSNAPEKDAYRIINDVSKITGLPSYGSLVEEAKNRGLIKLVPTKKGKYRVVRSTE